MRYKEIQDELIQKYNVHICPDCIKGYRSRIHAHIKERTVCKWHPKNSLEATFDLMHEIGHIETTTSKMRRCESEYNATEWAIARCREYNLIPTENIYRDYQRYINEELMRGLRRGGSGYPEQLNLTRIDESNRRCNVEKIFGKEMPEDCEKAIKELKALKVYRAMNDDVVDDFSDVWWRVQHECDMYEEDEESNELTYQSYTGAKNWLDRYEYLYDKYEALKIAHTEPVESQMAKSFKEIRKLTGLSQTAFGNKYHIPMRSIQNWEGGQRACPEYVLELLEFKVRKDMEESL